MAFSKLAKPGAARALLAEYGLAAKYDLGQNFLVDDGVVGGILELAGLGEEDVVLEVGPGLGTLTCALLPRVAAVVAVEADPDMLGPLAASTADWSERLAVVGADALKATPGMLASALEPLRARARAAGWDMPALPGRWVSNLPYAVAATLVLKVFDEWPFIEDATVMVQKEVADRIEARPGTKDYGAYTVKLRLRARVTGRMAVSRTCFFPAPHVDSSVVRLERVPAAEALPEAEAAACRRVVEAAFAQRRKTIRNSMAAAGVWSKEELDAAFERCGVSGACRAETLEPGRFVELARALGPAGV